MANFLNNKYGTANFVGLLIIVATSFFEMPVYPKMGLLIFGFVLFLGTIILSTVMNIKRYKEGKKKGK